MKTTHADLAEREAQRAWVWDSTRQLPQAVREALATLLELCRQRRFATLPSPFTAPPTRGEWTDLEPVFADLAEQLAAVTPVGDLWRVLSLLALEAAGDTVDLGPGVRQAAGEPISVAAAADQLFFSIFNPKGAKNEQA